MPVDNNTPPSDNTAESRASRAAYSLGTITGQTQPDIKKHIMNGNEAGWRQQAAFAYDGFNESLRQESIRNLVSTNQGIPNELLSYPPKANPDTILEKAFGNAFTGQAMSEANPPPMWYFAKKEMPETVDALNYFTRENIGKSQYIRTKLNDIEDSLKNQSWLGWGVDQILDSFQPYTEYKMRGHGEDASRFAGLMLGNELKARAERILAEPDLDHMKPMLDQALEELKGNPGQQYKFLSYIMQAEDPTWDNTWTVAMFGGAVAGGVKKAARFVEITKAARDIAEMSKSVGHGVDKMRASLDFWAEPLNKEVAPNIADNIAKGNVDEAAVQTVINQQEKTIVGKMDPQQRVVEPIASAFRKQGAEQASSGAHTRELVNRINENLTNTYSKFVGLLYSQLRINRIPDITQNPAAVRAVLNQVKQEYPEVSAHVVDMQGMRRDMASNNWYAQMVLGRSDAGGFETFDEAQSAAAHLKIPLTTVGGVKFTGKLDARGTVLASRKQTIHEFGATITQANGKFYIVKDIPIKEDQGIIKQFMGATEQSKAPWGPIRAFTSWISTPEESMSVDMRIQRQIATEGPSAFYSAVRDNTKEMRKLSRSEANDLDRMLKMGQEMKHPDTGEPGYYFRSIQDVDDAYQRLFNDGQTHLPSDNFVSAYFEFKHNMEMDYWLRKAAIIRNHTRLGAMEHQITFRDKNGQPIKSAWVTARREQDFPHGSHQVIAFFPSTDHSVVKIGSRFGGKTLENLKDHITNGRAKVLHIIDPDLHPLDGFSGITKGDRPEYIVTYDSVERPISWEGANQLGRTEGGHLEREYEHYISQARVIGNNHLGYIYNGDTNLFGTMHGPEARKAAQVLDGLRKFRLEDDEAGAKDYWNNSPVAGLSFDDVWSKFSPSRDKKGNLVPPVLSTREPIQARPKDKMLMDLGKSALEDRYKALGGLIDGTKTGNLARSSAVQYTGERDAYDFWGLRDVGTKYNPVFQLNQDTYVDAIPMMNRGLGRIINSLFMDDYKTSAVNHWLFGASVPSEADPTKLVGAKEWLTATDVQISHSPFYYFHHPIWRQGTPEAVKSALEADRMKIKAFIGLPSKVDSFLHSMEQSLHDSIYGKYGPKAAKLIPTWLLSSGPVSLSKAPALLRSIVFNSKMGFFSPRQFLIHFFTFINAALIAPKFAGHGAMGALFHGWTKINSHPEFLKILDERASKFGWKPGEWKEAQESLLSTSFNHVDLNQLALKDNPMANNIISNKATQMLDAGMSPFRAGVGSLKTASWYTAFKEYRDTVKSVGKLGDDDIERILLRANDLSHNMSRASTSSIQKGIMTYGAMFSSYNLRLAELLLGKRLTGPEKARLFFGYMGIFGVPTAGGIFGLSTLMRNQVDKGNVPGLDEYVPGYDFPSTAIMEGLVPAVVNELTGHVPNLGESYGAKDLEQVERTLDADTNVWQFFGGAAYETFSNTWANTSPFRNAMMHMLKGDGPYTVTAQDWVHLLSEISTANYAYRTYMGIETGKFMSRTGQYLSPTSPEYAVLSGLTGLTDQSTADIYRTSQGIKERRDAEAQVFKQYAQTMQQWHQALIDNNQAQADALGKRASILLQALPVQERGRAMGIVARDQQPLTERINWQRLHDRAVPDADRQRLLDIETKRQEIQRRNQ